MAARALTAALISILFSGLAAAAAPTLPPSDDIGATVLCYHIVESPQDPRMEVSRETFRQQMRYLAMTGYNVIPLRHLYDYVTGKRNSLPKNAIVVTIDDGWRSTYTEVFPEMKRYGFPFTVFVYPNIIGQTARALTWKQIKEMSDAGVDIESHSLTHPFLTHRRHAELDQRTYSNWLSRELIDSKRMIEHATGKQVLFIAYPFGDYDHYLVDSVGRAGYGAALTCEAGKVRRGSDPLRMRRMVVEKKMDFVSFRHYLGAGSLPLDEMTPQPGVISDPGQTLIVSARIPNHEHIDPKSVGMALLSGSGSLPFSYDPRTGAISVAAVKDALKGTYQRALVWATDAKSGKRIEASWIFRLPAPILPVMPSLITDPHLAPAETTAPLVQSGAPAVVSAGGGGSGMPARTQLQRAPKQ
ncbi:MAG TPA: polysaccharide deacetylase family protein [Thermoanaerobaculia bacterium]|jgi:peptidoglycan/xylan/chitin deacetylase (PgdA/CDA1 family)|nr:polysaccharide deacetylase family protein [Thermoanaerobaculia bacterium]